MEHFETAWYNGSSYSCVECGDLDGFPMEFDGEQAICRKCGKTHTVTLEITTHQVFVIRR